MKTVLILLIAIQINVIVYCENWEDINIICPNQCNCQYLPIKDLSIARWITIYTTEAKETVKGYNTTILNESEIEDKKLKFAMCMLHSDFNSNNFMLSLPQDLEALVLLYTGTEHNITVPTSDLTTLTELTTLEIRGVPGCNFNLLIDEPMPNVINANFESVQMFSSELLKRRPNIVDPSESFDYVPNSERFEYNVSLEIEEEIKILPYEVYILEMQRSKIVSFYGWKKLLVLRIHNCNIQELHYEIFDGLEILQHLSLENNNIRVVPPFTFFGALHIKSLSLARNHILNLNYRSLAGLLCLERLDLSDNNITRLSELTFPPFPKLEIVDLRKNPIKYIFPGSFAVMNNTKSLTIGDDMIQINLTSDNSFLSLDNLQYLNLNNITTMVLNQMTFNGLKKLEILKMKGDIKRIEFDAFAEISNLKQLILSDCNIKDISMDAFFGLSKLQIIDLSSNNLKNLPYGIFDQQFMIKEIYLQNNMLSDLPKNFFKNISAKLVRLTHNPWICNCEMKDWKQEVTNKIKTNKKSKICDYDIHKNRTNSCNDTKLIEYVHDNKMSPRCDGGPEDVKHRSVFYVLRRNMKCARNTKSSTHESKSLRNDKKLLIKQKYLKQMEKQHHRSKIYYENRSLIRKFANKKAYSNLSKKETIENTYKHNLTA